MIILTIENPGFIRNLFPRRLQGGQYVDLWICKEKK